MVGGVFVVPPLVASNDLGRVDRRWAEVWHGRRNDDDGTSTPDGFGATFLPIFAQDHTLVHHGFTLGTARRRCGDGLYPLRCSSCRASLWNASLIHCTELSSWEIRWLDCWGQQPIAGLLALDQCRRDFFLRIPFTRNIFHCLIDWLIDRCELIDLKVWSRLALQSAKIEKGLPSAANIHGWWFQSCGYLAGFTGLKWPSQGANLSDAERAVKELDKQSCAVPWCKWPTATHFGNMGQKNFKSSHK